MLIAERQNRLRELVARRGISGLDTLAAELNVSQSTIRRDIEALERRGQVRRTHGGVIWVDERAAGARPYIFDQRMSHHRDRKSRIAEAARPLIQPGQTILLDGGTTTFYLAQELIGESMQIVTNSLPIANLFLNDENVELVLTGGVLYPRYGVLLSPMVEHVLGAIHAQTMFFSVAGVHDGALYNQNLLLVEAERRMMRQAQRVVLLADSSKFGQQALARLCGLSEVHVVVADAGISQAHRERIQAAGCELILAEE